MVLTEAISHNVLVVYSNNFRKGLAPNELLTKNSLASGFWNIISNVKKIITNESKITSLRKGIKLKHLTSDYNAKLLNENISMQSTYSYKTLFRKKKRKIIFNLYVFVSNYILKIWYLLLR